MSNKELTLFIFEGAKSEEGFVKKLEANFIGKTSGIKCIFDAEIYQLYKSIKNEDIYSVDIVNVLKERSKNNARILRDYDRNSFAYVYLFFDYDAHSSLADDQKIKELLSFFDNETENGMLYISYPMVEALRHYKDMDSFKNLTVKCKRDKCPYFADCEDRADCLKEPHYKQFVATDCRPQLCNVNSYDAAVWHELIIAHLYKMNLLVNDIFEFPIKLESQLTIFSHQLFKYINKRCPEVAVLSAFPLYVLDYYGCDVLRSKLNL